MISNAMRVFTSLLLPSRVARGFGAGHAVRPSKAYGLKSVPDKLKPGKVPDVSLVDVSIEDDCSTRLPIHRSKVSVEVANNTQTPITINRIELKIIKIWQFNALLVRNPAVQKSLPALLDVEIPGGVDAPIILVKLFSQALPPSEAGRYQLELHQAAFPFVRADFAYLACIKVVHGLDDRYVESPPLLFAITNASSCYDSKMGGRWDESTLSDIKRNAKEIRKLPYSKSECLNRLVAKARKAR
jgi:hypothetical protein